MSASISRVRAGPSWSRALAPPSSPTCIWRLPGVARVQDRRRKNEIKFDFPAPFGPMRTVKGPGSKSLSSETVLNPFNVIFLSFGLIPISLYVLHIKHQALEFLVDKAHLVAR